MLKFVNRGIENYGIEKCIYAPKKMFKIRIYYLLGAKICSRK